MPFCPRCGQQVAGESSFCDHCGFNLRQQSASFPPPARAGRHGSTVRPGRDSISQGVPQAVIQPYPQKARTAKYSASDWGLALVILVGLFVAGFGVISGEDLTFLAGEIIALAGAYFYGKRSGRAQVSPDHSRNPPPRR